MPDLRCTRCEITRSYADADIADRLRTCEGNTVIRHTALGGVRNGSKHDWEEI